MIYLGNQAVGISLGAGELTKFEKKTVTFPNATNDNTLWGVSVSFVPKFVRFYGGTDTDGNIISGTYYFVDAPGMGCGGTQYRNAANHNLVTAGLNTSISSTAPASGANQCFYYDGNVMISRTGSNGWWSNTDQYTFEFYG